MKYKEKIIVDHWKEVLANYLDPLALIAELPTLFQYGSAEHEKVFSLHHTKHEAVNYAISTVINSDLTLDNLIDAIRDSGNPWLATLVKVDVPDSDIATESEKTDELVKMRKFLTAIAPHIKETIQAVDVADGLCSTHVISREEFEQVESTAKADGNSIAVRRLISHLVRKTTAWLPYFVEILKQHNYDAKLIRSLEEFTEVSSIAQNGEQTERATVREGKQLDVKAKPSASGAKNAANFLSTPSPSNYNQTIQSYDNQICPLLLETRGKNVVIFVPKGQSKARVTAQLIIAHAKDASLIKHKIAVIVNQPERLTVQGTHLKSNVGVPIASLLEIDKGSFRKVLDGNTVVIITQCVLNSFLTDGIISVDDFTLIIFDDCSSTYGNNYEKVLSHIKGEGRCDSLLRAPQVIGLLSSANMKYNAMENIFDICGRMNATGGIISVSDESECAISCTISDPFSTCLCETIYKLMEILATTLHTFDHKNTINPAVVLKNISRLSRDVQACIELMQIFNKALDIYIKVNTFDALNHLRQKCQQNWSLLPTTMESEFASTVGLKLVELAGVALDKLTKHASDNWDWRRITTEMMKMFKKDPDSRIMLIVEKEQHAPQIKDSLNGNELFTKIGILTESLNVNPRLSDEKLYVPESILGNLLSGVTKILVCTQEAASCSDLNSIKWNLTICYDFTREALSKTNIDSRVLQKYSSEETQKGNVFSIALMEEAIKEVQDMFRNRPDNFKDEIASRQNKISVRNTIGANANIPSSGSDAPLLSSCYTVVCRNCGKYVCSGRDIVNYHTNHTCINRSIMKELEKRKYDDGGTETKEGLHCTKCKSKLGIFANFRGVFLPQLHPNTLEFKCVGQNNSHDIKASKWAKVKIKFEEVEADLVTRVWSQQA